MNTFSAESIQLEAREKQLALLDQRTAKALSTLEDALSKLNPVTMTLQDLIDAKLCIGKAQEWLRGENDQQLQEDTPAPPTGMRGWCAGCTKERLDVINYLCSSCRSYYEVTP